MLISIFTRLWIKFNPQIKNAMLDLLFYVIAGAGVGLAVGLTGVGGGSLMTPILILAGVPEKVAIGTDLLYASITKSGAMYSHHRQKNIDWKIVSALAWGSIPASILTNYVLHAFVPKEIDYGPLLTHSLGVMLIITALVVFFRRKIQCDIRAESSKTRWHQKHKYSLTLFSGIILGVVVTLSSVGAGAFCAALLLVLYPHLPAFRVVGTDIAHAVPLTMIAGLGHFWHGNVDFYLLGGLLLGSLPAVHYASKAASRIPNSVLQPILASLLMIIGAKFAFFS